MNSTKSFDTNSLEKTDLSLGFIPLTDCAPLVIAHEQGYFKKYGLNVQLSKETSWANIRDKVSLGILDGAQMLADMPLAMSLGIGPMCKPMITAFSMDLNGNAITVSNSLYIRMQELAPEAMEQNPLSAAALKAVIDANRKSGGDPLTFAMVFPYSTHNYELRYWMAAAGIDPDRDVRLIVTPPPQMVDQLESGTIDGYCVGEPCNAQAVQAGLGRILITKYEIWNNSPEKVLGVTRDWAIQHPRTHRALIMALLEASAWLDEPEHRIEAASLIARPVYVNAPEHVVRMSMIGTFQYSSNEMPRALPDFNVFHRYAANFPWRSHAIWHLSQMIRWGHVSDVFDLRTVAGEVYRPDIYREAAGELGLSSPATDYKSEGQHTCPWNLKSENGEIRMGPDRFLDDGVFEPEQVVRYIRNFDIHNMKISHEELANRNRTPVDQSRSSHRSN